jgi:hypothetical protein
MTDIVERLREHNEPPFDYIAHEAASEIEQLRKDKQLGFELMDVFVKEINQLKQAANESERLRNALRQITELSPFKSNTGNASLQYITQRLVEMTALAHEALKEKE